MKKKSLLPQKVIIYDDTCPMCKWYTEKFASIGVLEEENRVGFSEVNAEIIEKIDVDRCRHEIPLYDTETQTVIYGPEALYLLLGSKWPVFKPLFSMKWFRTFIYYLYQIVTYNRRIIAGSPSQPKGFDCAPDFNLTYRWVYIILGGCVSMLIAWNARRILLEYHSEQLNFIGEGLSYVVLAAIVAGAFFRKRITYWGHLITVWLISNLIVFPFLFLPVHFPPLVWATGLCLLALASAFLMGKRWKVIFT